MTNLSQSRTLVISQLLPFILLLIAQDPGQHIFTSLNGNYVLCEPVVTGCYFVPCSRVRTLINLNRDRSYLFHYIYIYFPPLHFKKLWKLVRTNSPYLNETELITNSTHFLDWWNKEKKYSKHPMLSNLY